MKILKGMLCIFVVMLMISTVTAIPVNNGKVFDKENESELDKLISESLSEYGDVSEIKKLLYKWIDIKGFNTIVGGCEVIEQCNHYYNESDVRLAINYGKEEIIDLFENDNLMKGMFDIDNTFNLDRIYDRINKLKPTSVIDDIKGILGIKTTYDSFNESRNFFGQLFMTDMFPAFYESIDVEDFINNKSRTDFNRVYDGVDGVCNIIAKISLLWAIPLTILFGLVGLVVSSLITYVFFAPVTIPMTLYISFMSCLENNVEDITEQLLYYALQLGLVGLCIFGLPIIMKMMLMTPEGLYGITYVMDKISILSLIPSVGDYSLLTGEHRPEVSAVTHPDRIIKGIPTRFVASIYDMDKVTWDDDYKYRDYVRIGIDWDNDMIFDEWSNFKEPEYGDDWSYFEVFHTFKNAGEHTVNIIAFDLMGAYSGVKTVTINVKPRPRLDEPNNPLLLLLFFLFMCGFFVVLNVINALLGYPFPP